MYWACNTVTEYTREEYAQVYATLSASRKSRIDRLQRETDRQRSLAGELSVRKLLADTYGMTDAVLHCDDRGKPFVDDSLHISIAHCDDLITCAVDTEPIGIDVERVRLIKSALIRRVCTPSERAYVLGNQAVIETSVTDESTLRRFFEVWTAKEAFFKKAGTGITNFQTVEITALKREILRSDTYVIQIVR